MGIPSMPELLVILVVVLLVFGHKKLPEIGNGLGRAIQNFKKATTEPDEIDITPQASKPKEKVVNDDHKA